MERGADNDIIFNVYVTAVLFRSLLPNHRDAMKRHAPDCARHFPAPAIRPFKTTRRCLSGILLLLSVTALPAGAAPEEDCGELLKSRCEKCHYLTRVCQKLEKEQNKGFFGSVFAGSWSRTIKNMVNQGAKLTEAEQEKLTRCLDNSSPEVLEVCGLKK